MPRVKLSKKVRILLYFMQFYIVLMFLLIVLNFIQTFQRRPQPPSSPQPVQQNQEQGKHS